MRKVFSFFMVLFVLVCLISCGKNPVAGKTYALNMEGSGCYAIYIFDENTFVYMSDLKGYDYVSEPRPYEYSRGTVYLVGYSSLEYDKKTDTLNGYAMYSDSRGTFRRIKNPYQK